MLAACHATNANTETTRKVNLTLFDFQVKSLNFIANIGNGATSKRLKIIAIMESKTSLDVTKKNGS